MSAFNSSSGFAIVPETFESVTETPAANAQKLFMGNPRKNSDLKDLKIIKILDSYEIAAVLPEIYVTESGLYDLEVNLDEEIKTGAKLVWFACPKNGSSSEDDDIVEFYDADGSEPDWQQEISTVPESHKIIVSAWFNENIIYEPVIAIKKE